MGVCYSAGGDAALWVDAAKLRGSQPLPLSLQGLINQRTINREQVRRCLYDLSAGWEKAGVAPSSLCGP